MIVAVVNQKGGVGKTTTALNLAAAFALAGKRVLLVDLDASGNASSCLGVAAVSTQSIFEPLVDSTVAIRSIIVPTPIPGLDLAPSHRKLDELDGTLGNVFNKVFRLDKALKSVKADYDAIFIDTPSCSPFSPGGVGAGMALIAADIALVPAAIEELTVPGLVHVSRAISDAQDEQLNPRLKLRIALTMCDARRADSHTIEQGARKQFGDAVYCTVVPRLAELARPLSNSSQGGAVVSYAPKSPGALAYTALAEEVARG